MLPLSREFECVAKVVRVLARRTQTAAPAAKSDFRRFASDFFLPEKKNIC
jgi:hypothetical protein